MSFFGSHIPYIAPDGGVFRIVMTPSGRMQREDFYARDNYTREGGLVLEAYPIHEVQPDGSQKEVWYVP